MRPGDPVITEVPASPKRHARITDARLAVKRAERHAQLYPYRSAGLELIRDMRLSLVALLDEIELP